MLQDNPLWQRFTSRLHIIIATLVALVAAAVFGLTAGGGDFLPVYLGLFLIGMGAIMTHLGNRYWMLIPLAFSSQLPAVPVEGRLLELPEVMTLLCLGFMLIRFALKQQKITIFRKKHVLIQLYVAWAALVFINNPIGLAAMGSSLGGMRNYTRILLAFIAFTIMANQKIEERECKWIIFIIALGAFLASAKDIVFVVFQIGSADPNQVIDPEAFYTWHQALSGPPLVVLMLIFARYPSREIFSFHRFWLLGLFLLCVVTIAVSGKRAAVASIPLYAVAAAALRREFGFMFFWLAGAAVAVGIVIVGHGDLFRLPLAAQRALSFLPAHWDVELAGLEGGKDDYRAMLRVLAKEKMLHDPWIGTGYKVDMHAIQGLVTKSHQGTLEDQVLPAALGSAWHNTWLGYAADFGIPASIIAALIYFSFIRASGRLTLRFPPGSMRATLAGYVFLTTLGHLVRSHTSGHSAMDPFNDWWTYGLVVALGVAYAKWSDPKARTGAPSSLDPTPSWGATGLPEAPLPGTPSRGVPRGTFAAENFRR